ncbi:hypothetical protein J7E95_15650 [Streptomyces sp. ISL-14]|nr:hypothetical protein [Streptomyces sp. ISL-14]
MKEYPLILITKKLINVYTEGSGEDTYVFMSGSGIAAPVYELKGLYRKNDLSGIGTKTTGGNEKGTLK